MYSIKNDIRKLNKYRNNNKEVHIDVDDNFVTKIFHENTVRLYQPLPTLLKLHNEIPKFVVATVMGAYGSGKSTGINFQILFNAINMPPCKDGVRRCKVAMVRNTYEELKQTTFEMWGSWFDDLGEVHSTLKPLEYHHVFYDKKGKIELDLQFLALDKKEQFRKLRSSFFTFAYINEVSESPEGIIAQVLGRTGRYPSMDLIDLNKVDRWYERDIMMDDKWITTKTPYWSGVLCDTNPPEVSSEIYNMFEVENPRGYKLYRQPPGLLKTKSGWSVNPEAENIDRLGLDYYIKQTYSNTEEFIKVFCCGEYGSIRTGKLVYENYNDNIHAVDNVEYLPEVGLRLAFDTWYNPAVVITQYAFQQIRVIAAFLEENCSLKTFVQEIVKPYLNQNFPNAKIISCVCDPAAMVGEKVRGATSDFSILENSFGLVTFPASTNLIKPRLNSVEHFLSTISRGQPSLIIDKQRADILRQGFLKYYCWKENKVSRETIYEPIKNKYSHPHDALQYEAVTIANELNVPLPNEKPYYTKPMPSYSRSSTYAN